MNKDAELYGNDYLKVILLGTILAFLVIYLSYGALQKAFSP